MKFTDIILERKRVLELRKKFQPLSELKKDIKRVKLRTNFEKSLKSEDKISVICEYKPASPSLGEISRQTVGDVIPQFEEGGASAVSVLTEESFFKSNIDNLKLACKITRLPLLRKDFIMDPYQIYEARAYGASAVLLMAGVYPDLGEGIELCNYLDLDALVECKTREEIEIAIKAGAKIIGINNRDFRDFTIDLERTKKLAPFIPSNITLVSESGVKTPQDVEFLSQFGVDAILVGSSIMSSSNIHQKVEELVKAGTPPYLERIPSY